MDNFDKQSTSSSLSLDKVASSSLKTRTGKKIFKETRHPIYRWVRRKNYGQEVSTPSLPWAKSSSHEDNQMVALQAANSSLFRVSGESSVVSEICSDTELKYDVDIKEWSNGCLGLVMDEEEIFNMPVLLDSMAEGMLLTPLAMKKGFNWSHEVDDEFALTLWCD